MLRTQRTFTESVGESFPQLHRDVDCPDRHRSFDQLSSLAYIGDDIRDGRVITPALLAIGRDLESPRDNLPK